MPPEPRRTTREELARLNAQAEAAKDQYSRMTVGLHHLMEGLREDVRGVSERMATGEQVRRLEDKVEALEKTAVRTDAQEKLVARVDALEKVSAEQGRSVAAIPSLEQRQDKQEHLNSRMSGALWVVGVVVGLLGLAGLRDCGRWFVQTMPAAQYTPQLQPAPPPVTHRQP
ncbi:hypothetical protein ACLEPN_29625 [Myxococcus sp. 1LA]